MKPGDAIGGGPLAVVDATFRDGRIAADRPLSAVADMVMAGTIVVLKGVFAGEHAGLLALRREVFEWAQATPPSLVPVPDANGHCLQAGVSAFQKTPHVYHSYNLNRFALLPGGLGERLHRYFDPLRVLQNRLTGHRAEFGGTGEGPALHPQIIQYPLGGGLFGRHIHPLSPQRIGLIAGLSVRGVDYGKGGTCFLAGDTIIDLDTRHDLGDVALFRFDIPHWVNPSDLSDKFDWNSERGRWTMVLPYY